VLHDTEVDAAGEEGVFGLFRDLLSWDRVFMAVRMAVALVVLPAAATFGDILTTE